MSELRPFSRKELMIQVTQCRQDLERYSQEIADRSRRLEQTRGTLAYVEYILANYNLPEDEQPKKVEEQPLKPIDPQVA